MFLILSFFVNVYYFLNIYNVGKEVNGMYIKIYTKSQLILLRQLKTLLKKKYQLPNEILGKAEMILKDRKLGKSGFIAILLEPVTNDITGIKDILDCYPRKLRIGEDIEDVSVIDDGNWLTRHREWYLDTLTTLLSQVECIQLVHKDHNPAHNIISIKYQYLNVGFYCPYNFLIVFFAFQHERIIDLKRYFFLLKYHPNVSRFSHMILVQAEDDVMDFLFSCVFTSMKSLYFSMPLVVRTINI